MNNEFSRRGLFNVVAGGALLWGIGSASHARAEPRRRLPDPGGVSQSDPALLSAVEAASLLHSGGLHPREYLDACLERTRRYDGEINSWIRLYPEEAYAAADAAGERLTKARQDGVQAPLLCGLPVGLKDVLAVSGLPLTASSRVLEGNIAAGDSGTWAKLRDAGAVLMGHAHTDEFAFGIATPQTGNPWDTTMSPGGSSGGSAALLAARFAPLALGSDTGGSVRLPAAACGISAIKPTYGRVSSYGMIPLAWTRDVCGPMARSVADASLLLSTIAQPDPLDPITAMGPAVPDGGYPMTARGGASPLGGMRLGVVRDSLLAPGLHAPFEHCLSTLRELGAETVDVELPNHPSSMALGDTVELGAYHQQFADRLGLYRVENVPSVSLALGSLVTPAADYFAFERDRLRYQAEYNRMFVDNGLDAIVVPGTRIDGARREEFLGISVSIGTVGDVQWANQSGAPAVSVPVGYSSETGLPFGVQIGARPWQDQRVIEIGLELQEALPVWRDVPELTPAPARAPEVGRVAPGPGPDPTNTIGAMAPLRVPPMNPIG